MQAFVCRLRGQEAHVTIELAGDSAELRKARGAFFTPPDVTDFLARWAIRSPTDRVLEPSCGDGAIVTAVVARMRELGGRTPLRAHELHPSTAAEAEALLRALDYPGEVRLGDFLAVTPEPLFEAVVGNPPYVRYQGFTGEARAAGLSAALAQGVRLSRLASSWAPFVIHAAAHLSPSGRLALVLPAELLSSNYAQEVRDYLLSRFASVNVVMIDRLVFPGVQTEAVLLLAEGTGTTDQVGFAVVSDAAQLGDVRFDTVLDAKPGERWTAALVSSAATSQLLSLRETGLLSPLGDWGRVSLGAVTGNNGFFTLSPGRARELGLKRTDVVSITPAGSAHLRALTFSQADHTAMGRQGARTLLFRPVNPSAAAKAYIAHGEELGIDQAYKCRVRTPWWRTPLAEAPDFFFTYMNEATPQLAANPSGLHCLNSVHGVYLGDSRFEVADVLPLAALNSATALSAEVGGRAYGGGVLKMEPREASGLMVPSLAALRRHAPELRASWLRLRAMLLDGHLDDVRLAVDSILLSDVDSASLHEVREAHRLLSQRRRTRAKSRPRSRGTNA